MTSVKADVALLSETRERVLAWFAEAGRDLPWRATRDPYRVLVAEVLAQQTQAARAVACFALGLPVAPVDTNVARVLARSLAGADPAQLTPAARQRLADQAMAPDAPWAWSSALMDVGALHCRPRPRCGGCPLEATCRWRALGPAAPPARPRAQAPFATSDRRWRGAVVRALAAAPDGMDRAGLADAVQAAAAERPAGWFDDLLARLETDGMVAEGPDGRLRLPA